MAADGAAPAAFDTLVWAKIEGYRWWPAVVLDPARHVAADKATRAAPGVDAAHTQLVTFLATADHARLPLSKLMPLREEEFGSLSAGGRRGGGFERAVKEAAAWLEARRDGRAGVPFSALPAPGAAAVAAAEKAARQRGRPRKPRSRAAAPDGGGDAAGGSDGDDGDDDDDGEDGTGGEARLVPRSTATAAPKRSRPPPPGQPVPLQPVALARSGARRRPRAPDPRRRRPDGAPVRRAAAPAGAAEVDDDDEGLDDAAGDDARQRPSGWGAAGSRGAGAPRRPRAAAPYTLPLKSPAARSASPLRLGVLPPGMSPASARAAAARIAAERAAAAAAAASRAQAAAQRRADAARAASDAADAEARAKGAAAREAAARAQRAARESAAAAAAAAADADGGNGADDAMAGPADVALPPPGPKATRTSLPRAASYDALRALVGANAGGALAALGLKREAPEGGKPAEDPNRCLPLKKRRF